MIPSQKSSEDDDLLILFIKAIAIGLMSSHLAAASAQNLDFVTVCKDAQVQFLKKPDLPVRSVAHDWSNRIHRGLKSRYELSTKGEILSIGGLFWSPRVRDYVDFIEERYGSGSRFGLGNSNSQYVRSPREGAFYGVDSLTADVLVMHEVSNPEELDKPVKQQTQLKYTLTVSDRRTGDKLATMVYWIDMVNRHACGANLKDTIDEDVFILEAARIPIIIPSWEKERRQKASIKNSHRWEEKDIHE